MQFILDSIDQAAGSGHNFPAVVTALTVPDIAGAVDFPGDGSMKRYVSWVNQWFSPKFPRYGQHGVDGVALYALRCKLLHEGRSDPSKAPASGKSKAASGKRLIAFNVGPGIFVHLCTVTDGTGASWTALRADAFCSDVTAAARRWLVAREGDTRAMSVLASLVDVRMDVPPLSQGVPLICAAV